MTPQETGLSGNLRVGEVVDYVRAHFPDPLGKAELLARFGLSDGGTVVLTSHYLEEIEALARRVVVIGGGRVHRLVRELVARDVPFTELAVRPTSLEEAFLTLTAA